MPWCLTSKLWNKSVLFPKRRSTVSDVEVRLTAVADRPQGDSGDCADEVTATLGTELASRVVVGQSSGDEITVERVQGKNAINDGSPRASRGRGRVNLGAL